MTIKILLATLMTTSQTLLALPQDFIDQAIVSNAREVLSYLRANPEVEMAEHVFANSMANVIDSFDSVDLSASDEDWREAYGEATKASHAYFDRLERHVRHITANAVSKREGQERRAARKAEKAAAHQALLDGLKAEGAARRDERITAHNDRNAMLKKAA